MPNGYSKAAFIAAYILIYNITFVSSGAGDGERAEYDRTEILSVRSISYGGSEVLLARARAVVAVAGPRPALRVCGSNSLIHSFSAYVSQDSATHTCMLNGGLLRTRYG